MGDVDLANLFGSDDESDGEQQLQHPQVAARQAVQEQVTAAHAAAGLEDSDVEDEGAPAAPQRSQGDTAAPYARDEQRNDEEDDEGDADARGGDAAREGAVRQATGPPLEYAANLATLPDPQRLRSLKLSNILGIETRPFDEDYFQLEHEIFKDENGVPRVRLRNANIIRWRMGEDTDQKDTNARFVRWEDGSLTLHIGEEVLECQDQDISGQHNYLYVRHQGLIQGQAAMQKKLIVRPTSIKGGVHKALMAKVEAQRAARFEGKVKETVTLVEPELDTKKKERKEEQRIREIERLKARQNKRMASAYANPPMGGFGVGGSGQLQASYLEEDDYDDDVPQQGHRAAMDESEEMEAEMRLTAAQKSAVEEGNAAKRRRVESDDDDDGAGWEASDARQPTAAGTKVKGRMVLSDDESDQW